METTLLDTGLDLSIIQHKLPLLARDIVLQIDKPAALAVHYGLSVEQWDVLRSQPRFRELVTKALHELKSVDSRQESIRVKALYALDMIGITEMTSLVANENVSANNRIAAFDSLCEIAGVNKKDQNALAPSSQPLVVIHLGPTERAEVGGRVIDGTAA